jgi:hypothetical protein
MIQQGIITKHAACEATVTACLKIHIDGRTKRLTDSEHDIGRNRNSRQVHIQHAGLAWNAQAKQLLEIVRKPSDQILERGVERVRHGED